MSQSNYMLAQLQAMTQEDFIRFFPQKSAKWVRRGYKVDANKLMKAIILATAKLDWSASDNRGVREVWYNPVKPLLLRAIGSRAETIQTMGSFENVLSSMVKKGILTYADLGVYDFRTLRETYEAVEKAKCWSNILLFVEKDSAYVHLKPLQNLFNINMISGHGWSNTAGIEAILKELTQKGVTDVVVFTLTDYDPFGFAIDQEFVDKCETLDLYVTEHHRIGINVEHTTPENLAVQRYPIKHSKKLSVNGISFDSDRWLAEHGIDRQYGLEIEAVSGQLGGHQFLREIVAKELLKYLVETDRVEEITGDVWENAPFKTLGNLIYGIDGTYLERQTIEQIVDHIENGPQRPHQYLTEEEYLTYEAYEKQWNEIHSDMEDETDEVTEEIDDLTAQLEDLESEKSTLEHPYRQKMDELKTYYLLSRRVLISCLWRYYQKNKEKWPRNHYALGYPEGCLVTAIQEQKDLAEFIKQVDDSKIISDISTVLKDAMSNGEIQQLISEVLNGGSADE